MANWSVKRFEVPFYGTCCVVVCQSAHIWLWSRIQYLRRQGIHHHPLFLTLSTSSFTLHFSCLSLSESLWSRCKVKSMILNISEMFDSAAHHRRFLLWLSLNWSHWSCHSTKIRRETLRLLVVSHPSDWNRDFYIDEPNLPWARTACFDHEASILTIHMMLLSFYTQSTMYAAARESDTREGRQSWTGRGQNIIKKQPHWSHWFLSPALFALALKKKQKKHERKSGFSLKNHNMTRIPTPPPHPRFPGIAAPERKGKNVDSQKYYPPKKYTHYELEWEIHIPDLS